MSDDNQIEIPQSFIALYLAPGRSRPAAPFETILARYEQCEDMALTLAESARQWFVRDNLDAGEILARCEAGLSAPGADFSPAEVRWVVVRLAELMEWDAPA